MQKQGEILGQGAGRRDKGLLAENSNVLDLRLMLRASCMEWDRLQGICGGKATKGLWR